ncbi:MAG: GNAT family N-acetyltransferase [Rickettsiales bacterium]|nr:GNAT family N-acetyltransferase [Pseudomonadota bacterium]MDA0965515.1 GNAT family N-acetyltransferase [Pseudomonadota bacterium]MDG4542839.1 GNAT family N-acetyltransferase [Rickettsiales bacterium]MDG4544713.1 GNAT family N-acetyltransferase [Rickettsiales bacterium]MDG4546835.1 GNAT family N-acetyltransferase [Rickettsiales bacterium]
MVEISKDNFKMRPFKSSDALAFVNGLNTKTIARDTTIDLPCTMDAANWWISFIQSAEQKKPLPEKHFVIDIDGGLVGSIGIINIDKHKGELGYWLTDKHFGKGIMTKAINEMVRYCTKDIGLKRIFAPVLPHNKASARVLEKNGFELEGTLKKYFKKDGNYIDALAYAYVK